MEGKIALIWFVRFVIWQKKRINAEYTKSDREYAGHIFVL